MPVLLDPAAPVIVCGVGQVGYRVTRLLRRLGVPVVAIGQGLRPDWRRRLEADGATVVDGDVRDPERVLAAGLLSARALVVATDVDTTNLEVALDARRARPDIRLVLRIFNRDLAAGLERSLGGARAYGMSALAGPVLALAGLGVNTVGAFAHRGASLVVARLPAGPGSPLAGVTDEQVGERHRVRALGRSSHGARGAAATDSDVLVVGDRDRVLALAPTVGAAPQRPAAVTRHASVRAAWRNAPPGLRTTFLGLVALALISVPVLQRGLNLTPVEAIYYIVTTVTTTGYGDITPRQNGPWLMLYGCLLMAGGSVGMAVLYSFVTNLVVSDQLRRELGRPPVPERGHVILVGLGNVGYRARGELARSQVDVVVVDSASDGEFVHALEQQTPVVLGDARVRATLERAGVKDARALIATTGDDAVNLAVALTARHLAPGVRAVARLFDGDFAAKVEAGGLVDAAISASRVAAPTFAAAALHDDVIGAWVEGDVLTLLRAQDVGAAWAGKRARELAVDVLLAFVDEGHVPVSPERVLAAGDRVIVAERLDLAAG